MTEKQLREKVVNIAKSLLGKNEQDGSFHSIIDGYNAVKPLPRGYSVKYTDEWCATFVSYVGQQAGLSDIMFRECGCGQMVQLYQKANRWMENDVYVPEAGDIIMYDWEDSGVGDNTGWPNHVGIVERVDGNTIVVIEGNYGESVKRRSIAVNGKYIRGYCLPNYESKATEVEVETPSTPTPSPSPVDTNVDVFYQVYAGGRWLPVVKNLEDYAGISGKAIKGFAIKSVSAGRIKYQVHTSKGWYNWIWASDYNLNDLQNGFAGDLKNDINAIRVYYYTPDNIRPYKVACYRVDTVNNNKYFDWQTDTDTTGNMDGYAGVLTGKAIDRVQLYIK